MRGPRYRFPDQVRSTTRAIAPRMVDEGTVAHSPEQLDAWIAGHPDVRASLVKGGYGSEFTSQDLFPLLQVFLAQAGAPAPAPAADAPPRASSPSMRVGLLVLGVIVIGVVLGLLLV